MADRAGQVRVIPPPHQQGLRVGFAGRLGLTSLQHPVSSVTSTWADIVQGGVIATLLPLPAVSRSNFLALYKPCEAAGLRARFDI
jgi:hypothetical protein